MAAAIPFVMAAVSVAGTAYSFFQNKKAGEERKAEFGRQADQTKEQARLLYQDTQDQHRRIIGRQKAIYGASGVTAEGSPLLVQHESLAQSKEQLRRIQQAGEQNSAALLEQGQQAYEVGQAEGIKSLIGGAGQAYGMGRSFNWW
jgi:GTPase